MASARAPEARAPELSEEQLDAWKAFIRAQAEVLHTLSRELEADQGLPLTCGGD